MERTAGNRSSWWSTATTPHEPWDPPGKYVSPYDLDGYEGKEPFNPRYGADDYLTDRQLLRMRALYSAEVGTGCTRGYKPSEVCARFASRTTDASACWRTSGRAQIPLGRRRPSNERYSARAMPKRWARVAP
jgi:hypothetical protein